VRRININSKGCPVPKRGVWDQNSFETREGKKLLVGVKDEDLVSVGDWELWRACAMEEGRRVAVGVIAGDIGETCGLRSLLKRKNRKVRGGGGRSLDKKKKNTMPNKKKQQQTQKKKKNNKPQKPIQRRGENL